MTILHSDISSLMGPSALLRLQFICIPKGVHFPFMKVLHTNIPSLLRYTWKASGMIYVAAVYFCEFCQFYNPNCYMQGMFFSKIVFTYHCRISPHENSLDNAILLYDIVLKYRCSRNCLTYWGTEGHHRVNIHKQVPFIEYKLIVTSILYSMKVWLSIFAAAQNSSTSL